MAKGNFILHGSRKAVGNLVTYKRDGVQVVREKATNVSNPRTAGQANQRALFAPATKFYSPLSVMLEKSFEGKNKSNSYTAFLKNAINDARKNGWYVPKGSGFFPLPYLISDGSLRSVNYTCDAVEGLRIKFATELEGVPSTIGELSQLFMSMGYLEGDQVTLFLVGCEPDGSYYPVYARFFLAPESTAPISEISPALTFGLDEDLVLKLVDETGTRPYAAGAVIVSRYQNKVWRRSTQRVALNDYILAEITSLEWKENAIESYMDGSTSDVYSDVYLNGSTVNNQGTEGSVVAEIQLTDGTAFSPTAISYYSEGNAQFASVTGRVGTRLTSAKVKLGVDYLLTASTKGAISDSVTPPANTVDGTQPAMKAWLIAQGVAQSVF